MTILFTLKDACNLSLSVHMHLHSQPTEECVCAAVCRDTYACVQRCLTEMWMRFQLLPTSFAFGSVGWFFFFLHPIRKSQKPVLTLEDNSNRRKYKELVIVVISREWKELRGRSGRKT